MSKQVSFETFYEELLRYKEEYGNCLVPKTHVTDSGIKLGKIVQNVRLGGRKITCEQRKLLNSIGFKWRCRAEWVSFEEFFELLKAYKKKYKNCAVPVNHVTESGVKLGKLVQNFRTGARTVTPKQEERLDKLGFIWNIQVSFEEFYKLLKEYKAEHGNCMVPASHVTKDGKPLGKILQHIRYGSRHVTEKQREKLDDLGFVWRVTKK